MVQKIKEEFKAGIINKPQFIDAMYGQHQLLFEYTSLLQKVDISSIEITGEGVVFTTKNEGIKFLCKKADKRTAPFEILNFGEYESGDADLLYRLISNGDTIFDIGANIGAHTLLLAQLVGPQGRVLSFEPTEFAFLKQKKNLALNPNLAARVQPFQCLLASQDDAPLPTTLYSSWPLTKPTNVHAKHLGEDFPVWRLG